MDKFFGNLGLVTAVGLLIVAGLMFSPFYNPATFPIGAFQWLHVVFGITWIGLNVNFAAQMAVPVPEGQATPASNPLIKGLSAFRWSAALTVLTGLILAHLYGELTDALTLSEDARLIGIGMWLALIMATNVWFFIWPNHKRVFGLVETDYDTKLKSARAAMMGARFNTMLGFPMLLCMAAYR
jgi:uncharacterized membrane protein